MQNIDELIDADYNDQGVMFKEWARKFDNKT